MKWAGVRGASQDRRPAEGNRALERPTVSVVIPCYNYGRFLPAAVGSVTAQPGVDVDVLIIDDCSTDGSQAVARALADSDPRVRTVVHPTNLGHIATFNEGVAQAVGDYLVLMSADDMLAPGSLERATALLERHPSVGFVYGEVVVFSGSDAPTTGDTLEAWTIWRGRDWIRDRCVAGGNIIWSPEVVMRTSVQRQIGGYSADLPHTADLEMWLRAASVADVGRIDGLTHAFYRNHPTSLNHRLKVSATYDLRAVHAAFASVLATGSSAPGSEHLYRRACRAIANRALRQGFRASHGTVEALADARELESFALEVFPPARWSLLRLELRLRRAAIGRWAARTPAMRRLHGLVRG